MIKIVAQQNGEFTRVILQISSPFRDDNLLRPATGKVAYRQFIQEVTVMYKDRLIYSSQFGPGMAANPVLEFRVVGLPLGGMLTVDWSDSAGKNGKSETKIISKN